VLTRQAAADVWFQRQHGHRRWHYCAAANDYAERGSEQRGGRTSSRRKRRRRQAVWRLALGWCDGQGAFVVEVDAERRAMRLDGANVRRRRERQLSSSPSSSSGPRRHLRPRSKSRRPTREQRRWALRRRATRIIASPTWGHPCAS
jgi:hypothetical protein